MFTKRPERLPKHLRTAGRPDAPPTVMQAIICNAHISWGPRVQEGKIAKRRREEDSSRSKYRGSENSGGIVDYEAVEVPGNTAGAGGSHPCTGREGSMAAWTVQQIPKHCTPTTDAALKRSVGDGGCDVEGVLRQAAAVVDVALNLGHQLAGFSCAEALGVGIACTHPEVCTLSELDAGRQRTCPPHPGA